MKKILLSSVALLTLAQSANADLFVGLEYMSDSLTANYTNQITNLEVNNETSYSPGRFILGSGYTDDTSMGITYSSDNIGLATLSELGYYVRRGFDINSVPHFHPYFQIGVSYGILNYNSNLNTSSNTSVDYDGTLGLYGGVGIGYTIADLIELQAGIDYTKRWTTNTNNLTFTGPSFRIGLNIWFGSSELHTSHYKSTSSQTYKAVKQEQTQEDDFFY